MVKAGDGKSPSPLCRFNKLKINMTTNNTPTKKKFYWRAFISFYVVLSFIFIAISGIILYITPPGRVANWTDWRFLFLSKHEWQAVHTILSFMFVISAGFHIYFNWKVLITYLRTKLQEGMKMKRELTLSSIIILAVISLTLIDAPPFSTVMDFGSDISNSWGKTLSEPPIPHAELLTLKEYSEKTNISYEDIISNLKNAGIEVDDSEMTLDMIASQYNLTPAQLAQKIVASKKPRVAIAEGGGYGRKNVNDVCEQLDIPVETGLERLEKNGIRANANSNLKEIAGEHNLAPIQIVKLINSESINQ